MTNRARKRIMITGPTASGKSDLAVRLARLLDGEIISADSRQCYRRIDIGTAKPDPGTLRAVTHHNISILDPAEKDTVADFLKRAAGWLEEIERAGRTVIIAGGSTLHLQGLIQPFDSLPGPDRGNLEELKERDRREGLAALYRQLEQIDPETASGMDGLNRNRIFRALDVWMQTGRPFSSFHSQNGISPPDNLVVFGLGWPRQRLYSRINSRVDRMIGEGLVGETRRILDDGYSPSLQSLQTVGYREVIDYLQGGISRKELAGAIKVSTRRYAKRQLTWFRRWSFIHWLPAGEQSPVRLAESVLERLREVEAG